MTSCELLIKEIVRLTHSCEPCDGTGARRGDASTGLPCAYCAGTGEVCNVSALLPTIRQIAGVQS